MFSTLTDNNYNIQVPTELHGYKIIKEIDRGCSSAVVKVLEIITSQYYAAKIIPKKYMENKNQAEMIFKEIEILKSVRHPNIVKYYDWFEIKNNQEEEFFVIVEEYCPNGNLFDYQILIFKTMMRRKT